MTRMTRTDCTVVCKLIDTHTQLNIVATEVKRSQIGDAVSSSWAALAAEENSQGRGIGALLVEVEAGPGGGGGRGIEGGKRAGGGDRGGAGVFNSENKWEDLLAMYTDRENELSQTNRGVRGVCVGVVPRIQSKLLRAPRAPWEEAPARPPNPGKQGNGESYVMVQGSAG